MLKLTVVTDLTEMQGKMISFNVNEVKSNFKLVKLMMAFPNFHFFLLSASKKRL